METALFSGRSIWTMIHGVVLGGGALMALAAALFALWALPADGTSEAALQREGRDLAWLLVAVAVVVWLAVLVGTYVIFPPYRTPPPEGVTDLTPYPRALLLANPRTAWLHSFAMEVKEHMPWIGAMLATAVAYVGVRYRAMLLLDASLRRMAMAQLAVSFLLVALAGILGTFINKVAPLE